MPFLPKSLAEKITDLNYAYLLLVVILYIDTLLQLKEMEVLKVTMSSLKVNISLGEYIVFFALLIMFVGPFLKYFSMFILSTKSYFCNKFFEQENCVRKPSNNKVYLSTFESFMVRQNNMVGFSIAQEKRKLIRNQQIHQRNCAGFLLLLVFNVGMAILGRSVLTRSLFDLFKVNEANYITTIFLSIIIIFIFLHALGTALNEAEIEDMMIDDYGINELNPK